MELGLLSRGKNMDWGWLKSEDENKERNAEESCFTMSIMVESGMTYVRYVYCNDGWEIL